MSDIYVFLTEVADPRQAHKVDHTLADIVMIVFFAHLAQCEQWTEIHYFAARYEAILKKVLPLENGIPSKDTIRRVMGLVHPSVLESVHVLWKNLLAEAKLQNKGRLIAIDGKTMRGNHQNDDLPLHIVSAYSVEEGLCLGQTAIQEKSNEITAIPQLLGSLKLNGHTVTIDAIGTQCAIAKQIRRQKGHYVLAVKGNQKMLWEEISIYLDDLRVEKSLKATDKTYIKTIDSARSQVEIREYYQTDQIDWLEEKKRWSGLKTIGKVVTTTEKKGKKKQEVRYYISSLPVQIGQFQRAVRKHWELKVCIGI